MACLPRLYQRREFIAHKHLHKRQLQHTRSGHPVVRVQLVAKAQTVILQSFPYTQNIVSNTHNYNTMAQQSPFNAAAGILHKIAGEKSQTIAEADGTIASCSSGYNYSDISVLLFICAKRASAAGVDTFSLFELTQKKMLNIKVFCKFYSNVDPEEFCTCVQENTELGLS